MNFSTVNEPFRNNPQYLMDGKTDNFRDFEFQNARNCQDLRAIGRKEMEDIRLEEEQKRTEEERKNLDELLKTLEYERKKIEILKKTVEEKEEMVRNMSKGRELIYGQVGDFDSNISEMKENTSQSQKSQDISSKLVEDGSALSDDDHSGKQRKQRLSGAARRRFKKLIKDGHDFIEARTLALQPVGPYLLEKRVQSSCVTQAVGEEEMKRSMSIGKEMTNGIVDDFDSNNSKLIQKGNGNTAPNKKSQDISLKPVEWGSATTDGNDLDDLSDKLERPLRQRLSGAARKRFKWLVSNGHDPSEASILAVEPIDKKRMWSRCDTSVEKRKEMKGSMSRSGEMTNELVGGFDSNSSRWKQKGKGNFPQYKKSQDINSVPVDRGSATTDEDLPDDLERPSQRLSGAARKRFKWLVKNGYDYSEARELAFEPVGSRPTEKRKRLWFSSATPEGTQKKKPRSEGYKGSDSSSAAVDQGLSSFKIGIVSKNYPEELLSMSQLKAIQEAILNKILELGDRNILPQFRECTLKPGWMLLNCNNKATAKWLKSIVEELKPWKGADLKSLEEEEISQVKFMSDHFQNGAKDNNERILNLIKTQNQGLNVKEWKVIWRKDRGAAAEIVLSFDQQSQAELKSNNFDIEMQNAQNFEELRVMKRKRVEEIMFEGKRKQFEEEQRIIEEERKNLDELRKALEYEKRDLEVLKKTVEVEEEIESRRCMNNEREITNERVGVFYSNSSGSMQKNYEQNTKYQSRNNFVLYQGSIAGHTNSDNMYDKERISSNFIENFEGLDSHENQGTLNETSFSSSSEENRFEFVGNELKNRSPICERRPLESESNYSSDESLFGCNSNEQEKSKDSFYDYIHGDQNTNEASKLRRSGSDGNDIVGMRTSPVGSYSENCSATIFGQNSDRRSFDASDIKGKIFQNDVGSTSLSNPSQYKSVTKEAKNKSGYRRRLKARAQSMLYKLKKLPASSYQEKETLIKHLIKINEERDRLRKQHFDYYEEVVRLRKQNHQKINLRHQKKRRNQRMKRQNCQK